MTTADRLATRYLIVGISAGGIGAAEAIREVDKSSPATIVSDEPYLSYSRPLISKYLSRERTLDQMLFRPRDFYDQNNLIPLLGKKVRSLGLGKRTAELESGERITWEKLLIASGGVPIVPQNIEIDKRGVFTFLTIDDAKAIDRFLCDHNEAAKAVVIGGGLIGISVAEALIGRGIEVTVVELKERILNTILDTQASLLVEETIQKAGVRIITGHTVAELLGKEGVTGVVLDDGQEIPCSLVIIAIGVLPRTELVKGTDIAVNRGILVNRSMATSHPDVYACGDAAEAYDFVYGTNRLTPIWPNAYIGGRIAGYNMADIRAEYPNCTAMNSLNYFGLDIATAGMPTPPDDKCEVISKQDGSTYRKLILKDDRLVGLVFVGEIEKSGIIFGIMRDQMNMAAVKHTLLSDDFGLSSLPREIWQELLGTPAPKLILQLPTSGEDAGHFASE